MCTEDQHQEKMDVLYDIKELHERHFCGPQDATIFISQNTPYVIDYKGRKHIFIYSANSVSLTLSLEDLGNLPLPPDTWINLAFQEGMRVFAVGQASSVPIFVRATNEVIP